MTKTYTFPIIDNSDNILNKLKNIESFANMFKFTKYNKKKFDKKFDTKIFCEWFVEHCDERDCGESEFFDSLVSGLKVFLDNIEDEYDINVCKDFRIIWQSLYEIEHDIYDISIFEESDLNVYNSNFRRLNALYDIEQFESEMRSRLDKIVVKLIKEYKKCLNKLEKEMYKFSIVFEKAIEEIRKIGIDNLQKAGINVREQELLNKKKEIEEELNNLKNGNIVKTVKKPVAKKPCQVIRKK